MEMGQPRLAYQDRLQLEPNSDAMSKTLLTLTLSVCLLAMSFSVTWQLYVFASL